MGGAGGQGFDFGGGAGGDSDDEEQPKLDDLEGDENVEQHTQAKEESMEDKKN